MTMQKQFITADELLLDSFKLAEQIYLRGYRPNFIIGVWRGGTPVGIVVQEFLDYMGVQSDHFAIRTASYTGIDEQLDTVQVLGLEYVVENLHAEQELLIVDDVFDSGRSIRAIIEQLHIRCGQRLPKSIKVACPWFKPSRNVTSIKPNYFVHATDKWLVFPHELHGLSLDEVVAGKGPYIAETLRRALSHKYSSEYE